jgi:hypothetical protein
MGDENRSNEGERHGAARVEGASGTDITGGTDKTGPGGLAGGDMPDKGGDTGVRETGDIAGATSTHAGAGGVFENTGGTGTAPTE